MSIRSSSLNAQVVRFLALVFVLAVLGFGFATWRYLSSVIRSSTEARSALVGSTLEEKLAEDIAFGKSESPFSDATETLLLHMQNIEDLEVAALLLPDENELRRRTSQPWKAIICERNRFETLEAYPEWERVLADLPAQGASARVPIESEPEVFLYFTEVKNQAVPLGRLVVGLSLEASRQAQRKLSILVLGITSGLLALIVPACFLFARRITRPVEVLTQFAEKVSQGDLDQRVEEGGPRELSVLGRTMNRMASRLQEAQVERETAYRQKIALREKEILVERIDSQNQDLKKEVEATFESLTRTQKELFQAQKLEAVGRLTGGVAHDFNNLLQAILGNAEVLADGLKNQADLHDAAQQIRAAALNARAITTQLLTFSRRSLIETAPCSLRELVQESFPILQTGVGDQIKLVVELSEDPLFGLFDRNQLPVLLLNLCINAAHASDAGARITIRGGRGTAPEEAGGGGHPELPAWATGWLYLSVEDEGCGIAEENLEKIFEPFFSTKGEKGNGLGLAAAHGIVRHHGGRLTVHSEVGRGTTFVMSFPSIEEPALPNHKETVDKEARRTLPGRAGHILVIEDQDLVSRFVGKALKKEGYQVSVAADLEAATVLLRGDSSFDLVFADCSLPDGHILDLIEREEKRGPLPSFIFTSGFAGSPEMQQAIVDRSASLLMKPYELSRLTDLISAELEKNAA